MAFALGRATAPRFSPNPAHASTAHYHKETKKKEKQQHPYTALRGALRLPPRGDTHGSRRTEFAQARLNISRMWAPSSRLSRSDSSDARITCPK